MSHVDLSSLRMGAPAAAMPRRPIGPRVLTGLAGLLVLAIALTFAWPLLQPARLVTTAAVRSAEAAGSTATSTVAEAVGWVEADPFPVLVRPLVAGRIRTIEVLEGAVVKGGETVLATLESATLQAAFERAEVTVTERNVAYEAASTAHGEALARVAQNAEARRALAAAQIAVAEAEMRLAAAEGMRERTIAEERGAVAALAAQEQLQAAGTSNTVALERARAAAAAAAATTTSARNEAEAAAKVRSAALQALAIADELATNRVDLDWAVHKAMREVDRARAAQGTARAELEIARREWLWCKQVIAPCDGVVLRLLASPGSETGPDGEGILSLYNPKLLRARIDVPLGSLQGIIAGQKVDLRSEVTGNLSVQGVVQRIQHESDLLKNTLQVKVELLDPPALWRPETLCRARFLGAENSKQGAPEAAFLVPKEAVREGRVFVIDPRGSLARAIPITVVRDEADGQVVRGELSTTQRVILTAVHDGERVQEQTR